MATPASLFFQNRKYGVGDITFDLITNERHNFNASVTSHPVEDGSEIADHIDLQLENGSLNGLITNYSINAGELTSNRAQDVFEALVDLWESKTLVTVNTVLRVYTGMALTAVPVIRDNTQGDSLPISISFQKVSVVKLQSITLEAEVNVGALETDLAKQTAVETDIGETVTTPESTATEQRRLALETQAELLS